MCGLLAKRKRDIANMDETHYTDPDFGDVNWELDQMFGEVSEWLESSWINTRRRRRQWGVMLP
jgi:hypothetical protein